MGSHILAIDQGTTSSRAMVFDRNMNVVSAAQQEFPQRFPRSGWVEHDPEDIWRTVIDNCRAALAKAGLAARDVCCPGTPSAPSRSSHRKRSRTS